MRIDLNADVGESLGPWPMGEDAALIPLVSSVNVAAGFHAGDPLALERTVGLAVRHGVAVGAHPGYPDLAGFGRREMGLSPDGDRGVRALPGGRRRGVRPRRGHGAAPREGPRRALQPGRGRSRRRRRRSRGPCAGSPPASSSWGWPDRRWSQPDGMQVSRSSRRRSRTGPTSRTARCGRGGSKARSSTNPARRRRRRSRSSAAASRWPTGPSLAVRADTICIHGDLPGAAARALAVREALAAAGVEIRAPG